MGSTHRCLATLSAFADDGYEIKSEMELASWELIAKVLENSSSVGFIPDYIKTSLLKPTAISLKIPYVIYVAHPYQEVLSRNAQLFLKSLLSNNLHYDLNKSLNSI